MRRLGVLPLVLLLALAGCANPSLESEASALVDEVEDMAGVQSASLKYSEPVTLDSGKLTVTVAMADDATAAQVEDVGSTVYDAFREVHADEEGDLELTFGGSRVHVRSFEPEAETPAVAAEVALAAALSERGDVEVEVNTQDVPRGDHVESTVLLTLGEGTGGDDVLVALDALESAYGDDDAQRSWGVAAADGSSLSLDPGFPDAAAREDWAAVGRAGDSLDGVATVGVGVREFRDGEKPKYRFAEVDVVGTGGPLDLADPAVRDRVLEVARAQVALVSADAEAWAYDLSVDGEAVASVDPLLCDPDVPSELGALDEALRTEQTCPGPTPEPSAS